MTPKQKQIAALVARNGVVVLRGPHAYRTARSMMHHGYTYYGTMSHVGIALKGNGNVAKMACTWANHRGAIRRFDAAPEWLKTSMLKQAWAESAWILADRAKGQA